MFLVNKNAASLEKKEQPCDHFLWERRFFNMLRGCLKNRIIQILKFLIPLHIKQPDHLDYKSISMHGPETDNEALQVWTDIVREFAEEAELLAERIDG
jgi:hypothetical protein